jgi:hypothetical protein
MNYSKLTQIDFPRTPTEIAQEDAIRVPVVKASAFVTFALEESNRDHSRDLDAAMVTAATHNLPLELTPQEYVTRAMEELALAEGELPETDPYRSELCEVRQELSAAC